MVDARPLSDDVGAMAFVQAAALCQGLPPEAMAALIDSGQVEEYGPGEAILKEGAPDQDLFMVMDGVLNVTKVHEGEVVQVGTLERSSIFGEGAALTGHPRSANILTAVDTIVIRFPAEAVRAVADSTPKFGRRLAALMAGRNKNTDEQLG